MCFGKYIPKALHFYCLWHLFIAPPCFFSPNSISCNLVIWLGCIGVHVCLYCKISITGNKVLMGGDWFADVNLGIKPSQVSLIIWPLTACIFSFFTKILQSRWKRLDLVIWRCFFHFKLQLVDIVHPHFRIFCWTGFLKCFMKYFLFVSTQ